MNWAQVIPALFALAGALIGSAASLLSTRWSQLQQVKLERERRDQERERAALLSAREAIAKLIQLRLKPSQAVELRDYRASLRRCPRPKPEDWPPKEDDQAWKEERDDLLLQLKLAIDEFSDSSVRERLDGIHLVLHFADFWWREIGRPESSIRGAVTHDARALLGRISRGEPPGELSDVSQDALETVRDRIDIHEEIQELQEKERERRFAVEFENRPPIFGGNAQPSQDEELGSEPGSSDSER
ncbi:hypothetical protein [Nonomuraea roseoviolacea]|uniref:Uncharacterized protein n=1 Tax=Nonomuraea roseoviolacea subsp. carminata TaxID=160689 RepID=A0ABT1K2B8_9ACTN|nr:hypothetical protein [Nonomuraea roseoviolacea]MCP2348133.1 hypothetical protein [Nonomuraea roseoviolacea subsp. carminata]